MKFIIMCGGEYQQWQTPKHLTVVHGEVLVARTIRQLREHGVDDIAISSNNPIFHQFGVPVLDHYNSYVARGYNDFDGYWCDAFYPMKEPVCYIFGDVIFTDAAIQKIVETETDSIEFFASAPPFPKIYRKTSAEPFALKVVDQQRFRDCIENLKIYDSMGCFARKPIMWELWQVIKHTPLNIINYSNYVVINDSTCDIDEPGEIF